MKEMENAVGAVKCKLLGRTMKNEWEEKLEQSEYKVELMCLAMYETVYLVTETVSHSPTLPLNEDIPGTVAHVCQDSRTLWFYPTTSNTALDSLMDQLDMVATNLTPLPISNVFLGQLCAARFSLDGGMYRA